MRIFIDGDGCPVKEEVVRVAGRYEVPVTIIVDINHQVNLEGVQVVTVDQGFDSADMAIVNRLQFGDAVITNDIGLASLVLGKKGFVMDANGREINGYNVDRLLFERHMHKEIRMAKKRHKGPKKRLKTADDAFEKALGLMIKRII